MSVTRFDVFEATDFVLTEPLVILYVLLLYDFERGDLMGFWYFLILLMGLCLIVFGLLMTKRVQFFIRMGMILIGSFFLALSLFMFSPGSAEIIADLFNLNKS